MNFGRKCEQKFISSRKLAKEKFENLSTHEHYGIDQIPMSFYN